LRAVAVGLSDLLLWWKTSMFLARVTGSVVATQKVASMTGHKLLVVEPYRVDEKTRDRLVSTGRTFVVVDTLGAGVGELVLICQGSSARLTPETEKLPIDAVVIGLVDSVDIDGESIIEPQGRDR
jgi:microcompartment protein CcmK/EutM